MSQTSSSPLLHVEANPKRGSDMVVTYSMNLEISGIRGESNLRLRYIPDREIVTQHVFEAWLLEQAKMPWQTAEHVASELIESFYNSALPSFVDICLDVHEAKGQTHRVELVKTQPDYNVVAHLQRYLG